MPASLSTVVSDQSDPIVITLAGEFDLSGREGFEAALMPCWEVPSQGIVLDLTGLTFMDSSGIRSVVEVHQRSTHEGRTLQVHVNETVLYVLKLTGLTELLGIEEEQTA